MALDDGTQFIHTHVHDSLSSRPDDSALIVGSGLSRGRAEAAPATSTRTAGEPRSSRCRALAGSFHAHGGCSDGVLPLYARRGVPAESVPRMCSGTPTARCARLTPAPSSPGCNGCRASPETTIATSTTIARRLKTTSPTATGVQAGSGVVAPVGSPTVRTCVPVPLGCDELSVAVALSCAIVTV